MNAHALILRGTGLKIEPMKLTNEIRAHDTCIRIDMINVQILPIKVGGLFFIIIIFLLRAANGKISYFIVKRGNSPNENYHSGGVSLRRKENAEFFR